MHPWKTRGAGKLAAVGKRLAVDGHGLRGDGDAVAGQTDNLFEHRHAAARTVALHVEGKGLRRHGGGRTELGAFAADDARVCRDGQQAVEAKRLALSPVDPPAAPPQDVDGQGGRGQRRDGNEQAIPTRHALAGDRLFDGVGDAHSGLLPRGCAR